MADPADIDAALAGARRVVVVGADADLASVLTRLLRAELLHVEVAWGCAAERRPPGPTVCRPVSGRPGGRDAARPTGCR